jgi:aspartate kinase
VAVLVRKYGGTSLTTLDQVQQVARVTAGSVAATTVRPVVVVSARGATTDELLRVAAGVGADRCPACASDGVARELDQLLATGECSSAAVLALALRRLGVCAVSLTGAQAGIRAAGHHGAGVVAEIDPSRLRQLLSDGVVPVVSGFQGANSAGDVVTLGRGGSDTTAVALSAALAASRCEIYTDVRGVCTADPRIVATARVLPRVDVAVMTEMAFAGAKVVHSRAVELAALRRVPVQVNSSPPVGSGTLIEERREGAVLEDAGVVVAVTHDADVAWAQVSCRAYGSDVATEVFAALAGLAVPADQVVRSDDGGMSRVGLSFGRDRLPEVRAVLARLAADRNGVLDVRSDVAKVSVVGVGLLNRPTLPARLTAALDSAGIPIGWMSTSQSRISVLVPEEDQVRAVVVLHDAFALDRPGEPATSVVQV